MTVSIVNGAKISWDDDGSETRALIERVHNHSPKLRGIFFDSFGTEVAIDLLEQICEMADFGWELTPVKLSRALNRRRSFRCTIFDWTGMETSVANGVGNVFGGEEIWKYVATGSTIPRAVAQCVLLIPQEKLKPKE